MKHLLVFLFFLSSCSKTIDPLTPEELSQIDPLTGSYIYPVERSEYKLFELGFDKYYDTCIIPERILNHLTSEGLIESCLNYPPYFNLFYFDNYQDGFDMIVSKSNVFNELLSRKNIASKLISKYEIQEIDSFNVNNYTQSGTYSLIYLEILLSQDQIINQLPIQTKNSLIKEVLQKYDYRSKILKEQLFSSVVSALILGRVLQKLRYSPFISDIKNYQNIDMFLKKGTFYDTTSTSRILLQSREYSKNN